MPTSYWDAIHRGMRGVVEAKKYFVDSGIIAAGKTGTAEESKTRPPHAVFVGYAPFDKPEIALATRIGNGYSSDYAAQISCKVMQYYFNPDRKKKLSAAPQTILRRLPLQETDNRCVPEHTDGSRIEVFNSP